MRLSYEAESLTIETYTVEPPGHPDALLELVAAEYAAEATRGAVRTGLSDGSWQRGELAVSGDAPIASWFRTFAKDWVAIGSAGDLVVAVRAGIGTDPSAVCLTTAVSG